ncbi:FAD-dependent pyridine nucleotide-disulphide oxidoreductase [Ignisphaera aggregans DSM 17230]|uniref:FAD-dependent pyridine nucleotide-disulphide oxidoreductase n=1 Tax=Ignisphaera aggregans (strain DSM 17230 / JCM 13409 / AQ1.S1) TaxID=583356 RepID=E0SQR0_IGNAA|nr:FAD-dependent pyridine nucleotide-disulphide oxidoreductase [Ignisphaera aggregans DSM 17230]
MNIVVIGGGAAGSAAAARAKRLMPNANVILIEATDMITHGPCGIPYFISGIVSSRDSLVTYTPEVFERERGIKVLINSEVIDIDIDKHFVEVVKKNNYTKEKIIWDKLIIATGAIPIIPRIPGIDLKGIYAIRHPAYVHHLRDELSNLRTISIVGGSYLGIEMAEALLELGKRVILFEKESSLLPASLDEDMAKIVADELIKKGVEVHLGEQVIGFDGRERVESIVTNVNSYRVDGVILAMGVKPNVSLAQKAGIKIGSTGAIEVNEFMETNIDDIYAAGDVAEKIHRITKRRTWIPLAPTANKEGVVAGANAARGRILRFPGVIGTAITKFYDLYIARTGISEKEAKTLNIKYEAKMIRAKTKAHYYPSSKDVYIKMIIESSSSKIIGVQIVGWDPIVAGYIDIVAIAIERGVTIEDLFFSDLSYMPATAPVWHPLIVAARVLSKGIL